MKNNAIKAFLVLLSLLGAEFASAQKTMIYKNPDQEYRDALDLYSREKFGAARVGFEQTADMIGDPFNEVRISSEYYAAACALQLFHKDAENSLLGFMQKFPGNSNVRLIYFQIGKYYFWKKNYKHAAKWLEKADSSDLSEDEQAELYFKKGYSYFMKGNYDDAKKAFFEILEKENKYESLVRYFYSHIAYNEKNYETALQGFEKLKSDQNFGPIVPYYISQIYFLQEKYIELIAYAPPLLDSATILKEAEIARIIGEAYYRTGAFGDAIKYLERYKEKTGIPPSREDMYELAYAYYRSGDFEKAEEYFETITEADDELAQTAFYHIGDCFLKLGKKNLAVNAFRSAYKFEFSKEIREDAHYNYAKLAFDLAYNPYNEAVNAIQSYVANYPNSTRIPEMHEYLSEIFLTTKNYKDALESLEKTDLTNARMKMAYQKVAYFRGVEMFNAGLGSYPEAIDLFNKSLGHRIDKYLLASAHYWKAEAYYRMSNLDSSISCFQEFLFSPGAINTPQYVEANYCLGYCYFQKADYPLATSWFRKYLREATAEPAVKTTDAQVRLGDAYYMTRQYPDAVEYYAMAAEANAMDADYAIFQKSMALGLQGKYAEKINGMLKVISQHPTSRYLADAKFELGKTYQITSQEDMAIRYFTKVIAEHPNSSYVKKALLKTGLIHYAQDKNQEALTVFKKVVEKYPSTEESKEALVSIRNIYVTLNDVESFFVYVKGLNFTDISGAAQDSITYQAVENTYMKGDCDGAAKGFENYLDKFPEAIFVLNASYYKAECDIKLGNKDAALEGYRYVIDNSNDRFLEDALAKASELYYSVGKYGDAYRTYEMMEKRSQFKKNILTARVGLMRCAYKLGDFQDAVGRGKILTETEKLGEDLWTEGHMIIARSALALDSLVLARSEEHT
ncbi:MAG: tetratricopeptide repeat protein, partial [Bacteroidetes bacterium]|nr:tetratricopeptide repeat protein [Bacteroidota bacterium]MBU1717565.1 tetratricopeptide repeat protein [Bacteroidota bacterium]